MRFHEAAHAVTATLLGVSWHSVSVNASNGTLGRMIPNRDELALLLSDPDGSWPSATFAITALVGPVAQARWSAGEYPQRIHIGRLADFGGRGDLEGARVVAEDRDISIYNLLGHAIELVHHDRAWLAIQRVADALVERRVLLSTDVDRLVDKRTKGAGNW